MDFPKWAPSALVCEFEKLRQEATRSRREFEYHSTGPGKWLNEFFTNHPQCYLDEERTYIKLAAILNRLLSNENMREIWRRVSTDHSSAASTGDMPILLWRTIAKACLDFSQQIASARSPANKKRELDKVIQATRTLANAIKTSPRAMAVQQNLIAHILGEKAILHREMLDDEIDISERMYPPLPLSSDLVEGRRAADSWGSARRDAPLIERLIFWAETAERTSLLELLDLFEEAIQAEKTIDDEIKQPARGGQYFRPYLTRRLSEFMKEHYGSPLDDSVAAITGVCLNIQGLDRDSVRPYRKSTGKKTKETR
ncbi:hypothetical protein [Thauera sp. Sel9]|uniref:hypothetical protein n=1 Tax=Thauera sp. Sel9 TaxID=2974299 RepID=UPI0021E19CFD|nr:hypothetical protein [Thauera sp. Sel9]MCV2218903.1 hypothetical protein [Thauera sp. Sel9]